MLRAEHQWKEFQFCSRFIYAYYLIIQILFCFCVKFTDVSQSRKRGTCQDRHIGLFLSKIHGLHEEEEEEVY